MQKTSTATQSTRGAIVRRSAAGLAGLAVAGAGLTALSAPATAAPASSWNALAQCESGGNWSINTGNGYYGGLQFSPSSWRAAGGSGMPHQASKAEQIRVAENLLSMQGWGAWPACSAKLGLYGNGGSAEVTTQSAESSSQTQEAPAQQAPQQQAPQQEAPAQQEAPQQQAPAQQAPVQEERTSSVSPVEKSEETITVKAGDTLYKLAEANGVEGGWEALYAANTDTVSNADLIFVGQTLHLPA
ncbi:resuscitation-promoting factor Rpf [Citricoccus nitrophenolicus]|uniref:resuscitation-promoting factor Rpf n=1 Tax=Citricoccus nitrophenolicus TaxID=863575 RepID=UPI0039B4FA99